MKVIFNLDPIMTRRIRVIQNDKVLFEGNLQNEPIDLTGVSGGKVTVGIGHRYFFRMKYDNVDVDVRPDSVITVNDTLQVRKFQHFVLYIGILLIVIDDLMPRNKYTVFAWLVAVVVAVCYCVAMSVRYIRHTDRLYRISVN